MSLLIDLYRLQPQQFKCLVNVAFCGYGHLFYTVELRPLSSASAMLFLFVRTRVRDEPTAICAVCHIVTILIIPIVFWRHSTFLGHKSPKFRIGSTNNDLAQPNKELHYRLETHLFWWTFPNFSGGKIPAVDRHVGTQLVISTCCVVHLMLCCVVSAADSAACLEHRICCFSCLF